MLIEALGLLVLAWHAFDLGHQPGELQTFTFQTLLFFALFSLVSIRERRAFWASRPSLVLAAALSADAFLGLLIGFFGLAELRPIAPVETALVVVVAGVCCLGINDLIKVLSVRRLTVSAAAPEPVRV